MEIKEIRISAIVGSLCRMRLEYDYEKEELLASIREYGVFNPIKVKKVKGGYEIFAGHRRLDCVKELGEKTVRAEVWEGVDDGLAALMGLVENINRKDFTPLEEGHAYIKLIRDFGRRVDDLGAPCGRHRGRVYKLVKLVERLTPEMEKAIVEGKMSAGHGLVLLKFEDPKLRQKLFAQVMKGKLSVRELEYRLARQKPDSEKGAEELKIDVIEDICEKDPAVRKMREEGAVRLNRSRRGLKITVDVTGPLDMFNKFESLINSIQLNMARFKGFENYK